MSDISDYGGDYYLGVLLGINPVPTEFYVALVTAPPEKGYDGTILADIEPTDVNYARILIPNDDTFWSAPEGGFSTSLEVVEFPIPYDTFGIVTGYAFCTAATAGEIYSWGEFEDAQVVDVDTPAIIPIGGLTITISGPYNSIAG